jgi:uncharacterized membrane protein
MSLINPAILLGLGFAAIPIIIHLMMKAKPKKLLFPALRLIQQRRQKNTRRIRLRHFWLLALRILVLAAIVLAITRPALPAAQYGLSSRETLTLIAIIGACLGLYFFMMRTWRKKNLANHELLSRRSYLRGSTGLLAALLFAILVAWPYQSRVAAEITAPLPEVTLDLPVAAVFLFDTSLSMDFRQENKSRLELAQDIAEQHLTNLPSRSRVAIADTATAAPVLFQADMIGASNQIEALKPQPTAFSLNDRLRSALALQEEDRKRTLSSQSTVAQELRADRLVREVYIFTDMASSAWNTSSAKFLRDELERLEWVSIYLIDVGVDEPRNIALTNLELSEQTVSTDGRAEISVDVESIGYDGDNVNLEFLIKNDAGELVKHDQREVKLKNGAAQRIQFSVKGLTQRTTQGEVRLVSSDPLECDNYVKFSIGVLEPMKVAVVADAANSNNTSIEKSDANLLMLALQSMKFALTFVPSHELSKTPLGEFDVVCLVNVARPTEDDWKHLEQFVKAGGGLAVFLGSADFDGTRGVRSTNYGVGESTPTAAKLLPGLLKGAVSFKPVCGMDVKDTTHPVLKKFAQPGASAAVATIPMRRYWTIDLQDNSNVIIRFTDSDASPALIERPYGDGRTIMMTTSIDRKKNRKLWNELLGLVGSRHFLPLIDQILHYLSRRTATKLNYLAGEEVFVDLDRGISLNRYFLRKPSGVQLPGDIEPDAISIRISNADELGHFEVVSANKDIKFRTGFSINPPADESNLAKVNSLDLDQLLGPDRYAVAQNIDSLSRSVTAGRLGVEVFPIILGLVLIIFCLELTVSNRFYEADQDMSLAAQA